MELTPIRVRGKRRVRGQPVSEPPQKRSHKGPGAKIEAKVRRPKFSNLEKSLPLEVLEQIFWLSENVNFPRASLRLGRLLSGPATLRETFLSAFSPTWDFYHTSRRLDAVHILIDSNDGSYGNSGFQSQLLECSWATVDMILDCRDAWARRFARDGLCPTYTPLWGDPVDAPLNADSAIASGTTQMREARHYFYHDYYAFRNVEKLGSPESEGQQWSSPYSSPDPWLQVNPYTKIPDDLILGPWDEPLLQKFFWLVRAGAFLSQDQTWEFTHTAYLNAVDLDSTPPQINMTVVRLLHTLNAFQEWPDDIQDAEIDKLCNARRSIGDRSKAEFAKYAYILACLTDDEF